MLKDTKRVPTNQAPRNQAHRPSTETLRLGELTCTLGPMLAGRVDRTALAALLPALLDAGAATRTLHWGRNYLYQSKLEVPWLSATDSAIDEDGPSASDSAERPRFVECVIKQFRHDSAKARLRRRMRGTKARRSFETALALEELGVATPAPLLFADSDDVAGPAYYVCCFLPDAIEVRYPLRALNAGTESETFVMLDFEALLRRMGVVVRRLHEGRIWHRDLTAGNVLLWPPPSTPDESRQTPLHLLDLNRARRGKRVTLNERARELARMPIHRPEHQRLYLSGYSGSDQVPWLLELLYRLHHRGFLLKNESKKRVRGGLRRLQDLLLPRRRAHLHIPPPDEGASVRDRIVWDHLSDQPHQHASKSEKLRVRLADAPSHLAGLGVAGRALLKARPQARALREEAFGVEREWQEPGVALRPDPEQLEATLEDLTELGIRRVHVRLHPWECRLEGEPESGAPDEVDRLAPVLDALRSNGFEVSLALPQNRMLVNDLERWSAACERIAERLGEGIVAFQVGQAPNRSKWGLWKTSETVELLRRARRAITKWRP